MPAAQKKPGGTAVVQSPREQAMEKFVEAIMLFPEGEDDGTGIILDILNATDWEDLKDNGSGLPNAQKLIGKDLVFLDGTRHPSTIEGGLPWYLIVNAIDRETGEAIRFNTSAGSVLSKLIKLKALGKWPFRGVISKAEKPTRGGFYPLDLNPLEVNVKV